MKKGLLLIVLSVSLLGFAGCKSKEAVSETQAEVTQLEPTQEETSDDVILPTVDTNTSQDETTAVSPTHSTQQKNLYTVTELTMVGDGYTLSFPQIQGDDEITCDFYNELWLELAEDYAAQTTADPNLSYTLNFQVMTLNSNLLSILFKGQSYYDGAAYPTNFYRAYNIDLRSGETVRLATSPDLPKVTNSLANGTFHFPENYAYVAEFKDQVFAGYDATSLTTRLVAADYEVKLTKGGLILADNSSPRDFTYYENGELRILVEVVHALGDYVVVIPTIK